MRTLTETETYCYRVVRTTRREEQPAVKSGGPLHDSGPHVGPSLRSGFWVNDGLF